MSLEGLERLDAWRKAREYAVFIYQEVIPLLPPEEKWDLGRQIRRSAQSIPANLAEGYGRYYYQETIRFCYIARGSLAETLSHLALAHDLGWLPGPLFHKAANQGEELTRLINGYIAYLKRNRQGANEPGASLSAKELIEDYRTDEHGEALPELDE